MKKYLSWILMGLLVLTGCNASESTNTSTAGVDIVPGQTIYCESTDPSQTEPAQGRYDYTTLYLQVLEDLWNTDPSLRNDIQYISFDLSEAPGELSEDEINNIAETFNQSRGAELLFLNHKELEGQGYLTEYGDWEDGVLFSIYPKGSEWEKSSPEEHFSAEMYRASLGAYFFDDCVATWSESGEFVDYQVLSEAIS